MQNLIYGLLSQDHSFVQIGLVNIQRRIEINYIAQGAQQQAVGKGLFVNFLADTQITIKAKLLFLVGNQLHSVN